MLRLYPFNHKTLPLFVAITAAFQAPAIKAETKSDVLETDIIEIVAPTPLHSIGVAVEDTPSNVQVIKGKDIRNQQSLGIANYLSDNLLGVNVNETQGNPYQPDVNFHGFIASPLLGTPQGLSVYQDGVRINEPFGDTINFDLIPSNAISSINLLPGSNPLFGLNTLGGALSIQTKSGAHYPGGSVQVTGGSFGRRAVEGEYGGKLENGVDYFVAGNLFREDGWRDSSDSSVRQIFAKLGWHNETTDIDVSFTGANNSLNGNGYQAQTFLDSLGRDSVYTQPDNTQNKLAFLTANLNHSISDNVSISSVAYYRNIRNRTFNADINDDFDEVIDPLSLAFGGICDDGGGNNICQGAVNTTRTQQDSYGITGQVSWTTERNLLIAGLGYDRADIDFRQNRQFFTEFSSTRGIGGSLDSVENVIDLSGTTKTFSVFATDTYHLTPKLAATISGRYNTTDVDNSDRLIPIPGAGTGSLTGSQTFDRFNPAIGLTFTPIKNLNLFGGYNEGSRAPSSIEIGCSDPQSPCNLPNSFAGDPPTLKQVVAKTFEGGIRGKLGERTQWSIAAYRTINEDDIQFISSTASGAGFFQNVGETERRGFDIGLQSGLEKFKLSVGYSYVDATYESDFDVVSPANSLADTNGVIHVTAGNRLVGIPKHQFKVRGDWQVLPQWTIGGTVNVFSNQIARGNENNADPAGKIGGYTVVNLDTRYQFAGTGWNVFARVNNLFDRDYSTGGALLTNSFTGAANTFDTTGTGISDRFLAPGAPRAGWIGVSYEFGGAKAANKVDVD